MSEIESFAFISSSAPDNAASGPCQFEITSNITQIYNTTNKLDNKPKSSFTNNLLNLITRSPEKKARDSLRKEIDTILSRQETNDGNSRVPARHLLHCILTGIKNYQLNPISILTKKDIDKNIKVIEELFLIAAGKSLFYFTSKEEAEFLFHNIIAPLYVKLNESSRDGFTAKIFQLCLNLSNKSDENQSIIDYLRLLTLYTVKFNKLIEHRSDDSREVADITATTKSQKCLDVDENLCEKMRIEACEMSLSRHKSNDFIILALQRMRIFLSHIHKEITRKQQSVDALPASERKRTYIKLLDTTLHTLALTYKKIVNYTIESNRLLLSEKAPTSDHNIMNMVYATFVKEYHLTGWQDYEKVLTIPKLTDEKVGLLFNAFKIAEVPPQTKLELKKLNETVADIFSAS